MKNRLHLVLLGICSLFINPADAQEIHGETDVWFLLLLNHEISDQWNVGSEIHLRYDDYLNDAQQFLFRPYVDFTGSNKSVVYTVGYTYIQTYPYGEYPLEITKPENNVWEQVTFKHEVNKLHISHRYRLEHRWQGNIVYDAANASYDINGTSFSNRFRYRLTLTHPLGDKYFVNIFDELWVGSGTSAKQVLYDRNWLYAGLGMNLGKDASIQLAYLHQYAYNNATRYEQHHGLQLTGSVKF